MVLLEVFLEAHVAVGEDAEEVAVLARDGHAGNVVARHEVLRRPAADGLA
jgi:hypothetical protein